MGKQDKTHKTIKHTTTLDIIAPGKNLTQIKAVQCTARVWIAEKWLGTRNVFWLQNFHI